LNAGSSLCFPATFSASKRMVQLTGEAYFEVKPLTPKGGHKKTSFIVKVVTSKGEAGEIQVLGTHFNVNAYNNELAIKTTLLEGSVKIVKRETANGKENSKILKPGEQAVMKANSPLTIDHSPDVNKAIAWKNGYFRFKETGIRELMRQVERWYDVEVEYRTDGTDQYYTGVVSRSQNISALLQTLELTGTVHFQIDNKPAKGKQGKIIVLP
jgi:transmembrane sensor